MHGNPIILVVDDEIASLSITEHELRKRYGADYRIVARQSARAALEDLRRYGAAQEPVALVLADQWMPEMNGDEFLGLARVVDPLAKRVMLVAWGDQTSPQTILEGCAFGQIEFFVTKPWHTAPDERFHRQIADFLYEWSRVNHPVFETVRVVGDRWSPRSHELRDILGRNSIAYGFYEPDSEEGAEILREAGLMTGERLPVAVVFGGKVLVEPTNRELAEAIGVRSRPVGDEYDLVVIGAGPAGLAAAVYGSSEGLDTLVVEREAIGGQAGQSTMIHNYLGFPAGISGNELAGRAYEQAWQFGSQFLFANEAVDLRREGDLLTIDLADGASLTTHAVILATGITYRTLDVPRLQELQGAGVFYGSVAQEARALRKAEVYIVGGGNAAGQAALFLSKYAKHVTLVVRAASLADTMSRYLFTMLQGADKVDVRPRAEVVDGDGDGRLKQLTLLDRETGRLETVAAEALFVMIGADPHTGWLPRSISRDEHGFVLTGPDAVGLDTPEPWPLERLPLGLETSMPGVFAAGDIRSGSVKRVAAAVGEGAIAVRLVHQHLGALSVRPAA